MLAREPAALEPLVARCVGRRPAAVAEDERDTGARLFLNYGHTLGHALERLEAFEGRSHGEAIAIGMVFAARLAEASGHRGARARGTRTVRLLSSLGLETDGALPPVDRHPGGVPARQEVPRRCALRAAARRWGDPWSWTTCRRAADASGPGGDGGDAMKVLFLFGPNLGALGRRDPETYGSATLDEIMADVEARGDRGHEVVLASVRPRGRPRGLAPGGRRAEGHDAIVMNPGALTHYSYALRDAVEACGLPVIEVHMSNIYAREEFRRHSVISEVCRATITGLGAGGYHLALEAMPWITS